MSSSTLDGFTNELKPYDTTTGTIHFTPDSPIPVGLVKRLVRARMAETDAHSTK